MKKLLTILTLLVAFVTQGWADDTTTLFEGSQELDWNNSKQVVAENDLMKCAEIGSVIRIEGTVSDGAQIQLCRNSPSWTNIASVNSDLSLPYEYTVTSADVDNIKASSLTIQGVNVTVTQVTMTIPSTYTAWEGSTALVWSGESTSSQSLSAAKFANIKVGSVIKLEGSVSSSPAITLSINYPWATVSKQLSTFPLQYVVTSGDLSAIKSNGMTVSGYDATLTKVTIDNTNPTVSLPDNSPILSGSNEYPTGNGLFSSLSVGDKIRVTFTKTDANDASYEPSIELRLTSGETESKIEGNYNSSTDADKNLYEIVVSDETSATSIQTNGLFIAGNDITVGEITIIPAKELTWFNEYNIPSSSFADVKVGGKVNIVFTIKEGESSGGLQIIHKDATSWDYNYVPAATTENQWPSNTVTESPYSFDVTEAIKANIQAHGLFLKGNNVIYSSVSLEAAPVSNVFDTEGNADLSKLVGATYNSTEGNATITASTAWTGATLTPAEGETITGKSRLVATFSAEQEVTVIANYTGDNGFSSITKGTDNGGSDDFVVVVPLDNSKTLASVVIKKVTTGDIVLKSLVVDTETDGVPSGNIIGTDGKVDLTRFAVQDVGSHYNIGTYTLMPKAGYTGIQVWPESENVSGKKELNVKFTEAAAAKIEVGYVSEGSSYIIMSEAAKEVKLSLDDSKTIQSIVIQPTTATTIQLSEVALNTERTLYENEKELLNPTSKPTMSKDTNTQTIDYWKFGNAADGDKIIVLVSNITTETEGDNSGKAKLKMSAAGQRASLGHVWGAYADKEFTSSTTDLQEIVYNLTGDNLTYVKNHGFFVNVSYGSFRLEKISLISATDIPTAEPNVFDATTKKADLSRFTATNANNYLKQDDYYQFSTSNTTDAITLDITSTEGVKGANLGVQMTFAEAVSVKVTYKYDGDSESQSETFSSVTTATIPLDESKALTQLVIQSTSTEAQTIKLSSVAIVDYSSYLGTELVTADGSEVASTAFPFQFKAESSENAGDGTNWKKANFAASQFTSVKAGDKIYIYATVADGSNIALQEYGGGDAIPNVSDLSVTDGKAVYELTATAAAFLKDNGASLTGKNYTVNKVTLVAGDGTASNTVTMDVANFYEITGGKRLYFGSGSAQTISGNKELTFTFSEATTEPTTVEVIYVNTETISSKSAKSGVTTITVPLTADATIKKIEVKSTGTISLSAIAITDAQTKYTLTTSAINGSITVKKGDTETIDTEFDANTELTLTATATTDDYELYKWMVNDQVSTETTTTMTVEMTADMDVKVVFKQKDSDATAVWTGYETLTSSTYFDTYSAETTLLSNIVAGDTILVFPVDVAEDASYQLQYKDGEGWNVWTDLVTGTSIPDIIKYVVTSETAALLAERGLVVKGDGYSIRKISVHSVPATPVFSDGKADLSKFGASGNDTYDTSTYTQTVSKAWEGGIGLTIPASENVKGKYLVVKFAEATAVKVMTGYSDNSTAPNVIMSSNATEVKVALDVTKVLTQVVIQGITDGQTVKLSEVSISNKCTLTTSAANGTIAVKAGSETTTATEFEYGTELTLTATPSSSDYSFKQWTSGESVISTENPYTFTITSDTTLTAEFKSADEDVIWIGSQVIDWSNGGSQTITVTEDDNLKIADQLVFTIEPSVEGLEWPQLQLSSNSDGTPVLIGTANTAIDENTTEVRYYVTKAMLNDITENGGFIVSGAVFTLKKVKIERYTGSEDYSKAIWIGEKVYPSGWSVYTTIGKDIFANATAGQVIRMKYKDVKTGSAMSFSYDNDGWKELPDAASVTPSGLATKLTITEDMLTALQAGGLIISGVNFTLTSVELLDASDVKELTSTVSVTGDDWVWTSSETPSFTVNVTNENDEAVTAEAVLMIKTDKLADVKTLTESKEIAANGSETITFTYKPESAGFYNATVIVNDETVRSFYFGYAPTEIVSAADKQSDFDTFWTTAKTQLATIEASDEPVLTEITSKSTSKRKVYLVEMKSVADGTSGDGVTVRGYYCEPTDGVKHPVIMHYLGYDSEYRPAGQDGAPYCPDGDANPDFAEFYLSTRGQSINNRKASERNDGIEKDFTNEYGDWFAYNFGKKDSYYYRGAYMDCVRAIDFMASRETSDMDNLFAEGQSQGGAFTYAAAALSGRTFKAIAPAITFMGDFPDYFQLTNWPASVAKENQGTMTDAEMYAFLSYFDTKNLATKISCPVITSIGVQDNVCPPHTNIAPYNNVTTDSGDKQVIYNAELQHATNSEWNTVMMAFFDKYNTWVDPNSTKLEVEEKRTLWTGSENLGTEWPAVASQSATVGGILEEGEKFLITVSAIEKDATDIQVMVRSADYEHTLGFSKFDDFDSYPAEVKLILSAADVEAFKNGFHFTGKNCTITKVVLYKPTPVNRTERTLLEQKQAVGDGITINRGLFSNAAEEDVLKVYFEVANDVTAKINLEDMDYNGIENSWPELTTSPYAYTFTATALKKIQDSGMRIRGENFTFLKATLYTEMELGAEIIDIKTYTLTVNAAEHGSITVKKGETEVEAGTFDEDTELTLTATPDEGYQFVKWQKNGEDAGTDNTLTVKMDGDISISAFFEEIPIPIIDEETGEADLEEMTAQDNATTTVTYDEETETITMTTTEAYKAAQIWFNEPEEAKGNVLIVDITEPAVNVTVTVRYADGTESSMTSTTAGAQRGAKRSAATRRAAEPGTRIAVPVDMGKKVQSIEVKNAEAGTIHITKMAIATRNVFTDGKADLSMAKAQSNATYDVGTYTLATTKGWTGLTITPLTTETVKGVELMVKFAANAKVKVAVKYTDGEGPNTIMDTPASYVKMTLDADKSVKEITIQPTEAAIVQFTEVAVNQTATPDELPEPVFTNGKADLSKLTVQDASRVMYNTETYKMATTDGWIGVELNTSEAETVSGAELAVIFTEPAKVKVVVIYNDDTQTDTISEQAQEETRLLLEATKSIKQIQIQPTEAGALQFKEIVVRQTVTPDPEPVYLFNDQGVADLSLFQPMGDNAAYDTTTHQLTTTENWAGIQAWLDNTQAVKGNVLSMKLAEENANVRITVSYTDGTENSADASDTNATETGTEILVANDATKEIQKVMIQMPEAGSVTLLSISGMDFSVSELAEGESRLLWKNSQGEHLAWNDICRKGEAYGAVLKEDQQLYIAIASRDEDNDWPKVMVRDLNGNTVGEVMELNKIKQFPYVARIDLTADMVEQMADGFTICGDGITVTRIDIYQPYAPQPGDINLKALNGGWNSTYDATTHTITTTARWAACGWDIGDDRYNDYDLILVKFDAVDFPVTLKMEYTDADGKKQATSAGVAAGSTAVELAIPESLSLIDKVYLIWQKPASLTLTSAEVLKTSQETVTLDLELFEAMGDKVTYDNEAYIMTSQEGYTGIQLWLGDANAIEGGQQMTLTTANEDAKLRLTVGYTDGTEASVDGTGSEFKLELDDLRNIQKVMIQNLEAGVVTLTSLKVTTRVFGEPTIPIKYTGSTDIDTLEQDTDEGEWYNLNGQRTTAPQKGLYIRNGRKVIK